jgi:replicative DNA helicase
VTARTAPPLVDEQTEVATLGYYLVRGLEGFQAWPARAFDFMPGPRRATYEAIERLAARGEAIELPTVHAELLTHDQLTPPISAVVLADYAEAAATSPGMLLDRLRDLTARRLLARACEWGQHAAHDPAQTADATVEYLLGQLAQVTATVARLDDAPELPTLEQQWLAARESGDASGLVSVRSDFVDLDHLLGDLPRGEVVIVGARPGVGKSVFTFQHALHAARAGAHVLFASAEMTWEELVARAETWQTGVPLRRLLGRGPLVPEDMIALRQEALPPVRIFDKAAMTTGDIRALVARYALTPRPFDLVAVDHLHHLVDPATVRETRYVQVSRMIAALKDVAKAHRCVVMVACQLNRDAADQAPTLANLRDTGTIEEVASIVLLLHRAEKTKTECEVRIAKHRNGPCGLVKLYFDADGMQFRDFERREGPR